MLALLLQLFALACISPMRVSTWILVNTKQFEIFSTQRVEKTKALATELGRIYALMVSVAREATRPGAIARWRRRTWVTRADEGLSGFI